MAKKFCPKCGTERQGNEKFCRKCGYQFAEAASTVKQPAAQPKVQPQRRSRLAPKPRKPMSKKQKAGLIGIGVVIVALIAFFVWGNNYYSETNQIDRIAQDLSSTKKDASGIVTTSDPNLKITSSTVKPLQEYFENNKDDLNSLVSDVESGASLHGITLVQDGHYWLFFPKYKLNVPAAYAKVETNHAGSTVYVDGKNVGKATGSDGEYTKNVGPYFPGTHTFQVKTNVNGRNLQTNQDADDIWGQSNDEQMTITTATFKVKSIAGATVLLDGKNVGKLDGNGELEFKDYPITKGLELQVQANVNGKTVTSKKMNVYDQVEDDTKTLSPKFAGVISESDAQSLLSAAFDQSTATSDQGADLYQNQEGNSDFKQVKQMFDGFNKNDNNDSYTTDVTVKSIMPGGDGKSDVVYDVKYVFDRSDGSQLAQVMEYSGCVLEKNPNYDKNDEGQPYMIDTIGKGKMIQNNTVSGDDNN
ncbi:zinc ribbon domain-containing protein [Ligilactobacillus aviarius]|uniref:Uncharacterized protein n=1 Tax=Ligilactobacillus aviarius TaxID=1606 RepID=A0A510WT38_9LACO|nr:zinc-ribbon domain-containing protein [Ligilactobacillus aviarius]KRM39525.1 hypothetical protein FC33_GL000797 [Ligilactobacillus aviarius subsp. aviarius DSM 20655]GEK42383.1 hypothetical protein LAV01_12150 [Ligilactobacillus aviarius]